MLTVKLYGRDTIPLAPTLMVPLPNTSAAPFPAARVPLFTRTPPLKVLAPDRVVVPTPVAFSAPAPLSGWPTVIA